MDTEIIEFKSTYLIPVVGLFQSEYDLIFRNQKTRQTPLEAILYYSYQAITSGSIMYITLGLEKLLH